MKRNVDLIRSIVLAIRDDDMSVLEDLAADEVAYHKWLIVNAGLATNTEIRYQASAALTTLTWEGQNFIDAAANEQVWSQAKQIALDSTGNIGFAELQEILLYLNRKAIREHLCSADVSDADFELEISDAEVGGD